MVLNRIPAGAFYSFLFLATGSSVFAQQSDLQIAFFPRTLTSLATATSVTDTSSYWSVVNRRPAPFTPTTSDRLIARAEEKFQSGKRAYQAKDVSTARENFDQAVDLMLEASAEPTDRTLYESRLEQMIDSIHRYDLAGLGAGVEEQQAEFEKAPLDDILQLTFPVDPAIKPQVAQELHSTVSALPLTMNDAVLSYINYFSGRGRRTIVAGLEREARYAPMISKILAEEGVPQELIHLAEAESGFLPRAVSYRAAVGMWQFVQFRGREYGLNQTPFVDDRLDPEKATRAAAHHLHDLYRHFGDWYLAIAAYNCGPNAIERAIERTGYADFWELRGRRAIPIETTNYVPIILAMTIMAKNAQAYGLTDLNPEKPLEYDTVRVTSPTHLALVADLTDTPVSQLLEMNPALLKNMAPDGYELHVPKSSGESLQAELDLFPADRRVSWRMHRVESGESLSAIAQRFHTPVSRIEAANQIPADGPRAGDRLIIPADYYEAPAKAVSGKASHRMLARGGTLKSRRRSSGVTHVASRSHRTAAHSRA